MFRHTLLSLSLGALIFAPSVYSAAGPGNDSILSQHIKEADGTSGQNTNSGSGVKTDHIQNAAITTGKIANGAVTDAKITGQISTSKLNVGTGSGTVAAGDHDHDAVYQKKYANVVVVAKNGGDFTDPVAAVDSIADASPTNPYLVKIMPGVYDVGSSRIVMKQFVDIEGSGETVTRIIGTGGPTPQDQGQNAVLQGASNAELRSLSVETDGSPMSYNHAVRNLNASPLISNVRIRLTGSPGGYMFGVFNLDSSSPKMRDVSIACESSANECHGIENINGSSVLMTGGMISMSGTGYLLGIFGDNNTTVVLDGVTITAPLCSDLWFCQGVFLTSGSSLTLSNAKISAGRAIEWNAFGGGTVLIDHSVIEATEAVDAYLSGLTLRVGASKLVGTVIGNGSHV